MTIKIFNNIIRGLIKMRIEPVQPESSVTTDELFYFYDPATSYSGSGTTLSDLSGNNRDATIVGSPGYVAGTDAYFNFDGIDDYILSPNMYNGIDNKNHTVEVWINPGPGDLSIWSDVGQTTPNVLYHFAGSQIYEFGATDQIVTNLWNGGIITTIAGEDDFRNNWIQIIRTYNGSVMKAYINGIFSSQITTLFQSPWDLTSGNVWHIAFGAEDITPATDTTANQYSGRYGVIRFNTRKLLDSEILENFKDKRVK